MTQTTKHWSVTVKRNGEELVTLESNFLSRKENFSKEEEETIRLCADHLRSFIGNPREELTNDTIPF